MTTLFFDSSALTKRYLTETGSTWVAAAVALPGLAFIAADDDLLAARAEGLTAENLNVHP